MFVHRLETTYHFRPAFPAYMWAMTCYAAVVSMYDWPELDDRTEPLESEDSAVVEPGTEPRLRQFPQLPSTYG